MKRAAALGLRANTRCSASRPSTARRSAGRTSASSPRSSVRQRSCSAPVTMNKPLRHSLEEPHRENQPGPSHPADRGGCGGGEQRFGAHARRGGARAPAGCAIRLVQPRTYPARLAQGARALAQAEWPALRTRMPARPFSLYEGDYRRAGARRHGPLERKDFSRLHRTRRTRSTRRSSAGDPSA